MPSDDGDERGQGRRAQKPMMIGELRAVEAAREHVAAEVVGAERERPRRGLQPVDRD